MRVRGLLLVDGGLFLGLLGGVEGCEELYFVLAPAGDVVVGFFHGQCYIYFIAFYSSLFILFCFDFLGSQCFFLSIDWQNRFSLR